MQVISYTDARNSLKAVIDKVIDDQAPTLIHRREGGNAVLMSEEAYASMQETFYLMSNTDKGAVASIRKWLEQHGVEP